MRPSPPTTTSGTGAATAGHYGTDAPDNDNHEHKQQRGSGGSGSGSGSDRRSSGRRRQRRRQDGSKTSERRYTGGSVEFHHNHSYSEEEEDGGNNSTSSYSRKRSASMDDIALSDYDETKNHPGMEPMTTSAAIGLTGSAGRLRAHRRRAGGTSSSGGCGGGTTTAAARRHHRHPPASDDGEGSADDLVHEAMLRAKQARLMEQERNAEREAWERGEGGKNRRAKPDKLSGKSAVEWAKKKGEEMELVEGDEYAVAQAESVEQSSSSCLQQAAGEASGDEPSRRIQRRVDGESLDTEVGASAMANLISSQRSPQHHNIPDGTTAASRASMSYSSPYHEVEGTLNESTESERRRSGAAVRSAHGRASRLSQRSSARRKRKKKKKKKEEPGEMICGWGAPGTGDTDTSSVGSLGLLSNAELDQYYQEMYGDASVQEDDAPPASPALSSADGTTNSLLETKPALPATVVAGSASAVLEDDEFEIDDMRGRSLSRSGSQKNGSEIMKELLAEEDREDLKYSSSSGVMYISARLNDELPCASDVDQGQATGTSSVDVELEPRQIMIEDDSEPIRLRSRGSLSQEMIVGWDKLSVGTNSVGFIDLEDDLSASDEDAEAGGKLYFSQWRNRVGSSECLVNMDQLVPASNDDEHSSSGTDLEAYIDDNAEEDTEAKLRRRKKASARKSLEVSKAIRDIEALAFMQIMDEPPMPSMSKDETHIEADNTAGQLQKPASLALLDDQKGGATIEQLPQAPVGQDQDDQAKNDIPVSTSDLHDDKDTANPPPQLDTTSPPVALVSSNFNENNLAAGHPTDIQGCNIKTSPTDDVDDQNDSVPDSQHPPEVSSTDIKVGTGTFLIPTGLSLRDRYSKQLGDIDECGESQCSSMRSVFTDTVGISERSLAHSLQTKESSGRSLIRRDSSGRSILVKDGSDRNMDATPADHDVSEAEENHSAEGVSSRRSSLNVYDLGDILEEEGEEDSVEKEETIFAREQRRSSMDMVLTSVNDLRRQRRRGSTGSSLDGSNASPRDLHVPGRGGDRSLNLADIAEDSSKGKPHQQDGASNSSGAHSAAAPTNAKRSSLIRLRRGSLQSQISQRSMMRNGSMDTTVSGLTTGSLTGIAMARRGSNLSHSSLQPDTVKFHSSGVSAGNMSLEGSTIIFPTTAPGRKAGRQAVLVRSDEMTYEKKTVPKPDGVRAMIRKAIEPNILFKTCSDEEIVDLVDVFEPSSANAGKVVIKQGDEGNYFYVMEKGILDVYEGDKHVCALYAGTAFGEIALLYGCPRSATLRARCDCKLWSIDRRAYRGITGQYKRKRMEVKIAFLRKVAINDKKLGDVLSSSEITAMASATRGNVFKEGELIINEGEEGSIFYMIESGDVDVFIEAKGDTPVVTLSSGAFFGEKALLSDDKRSATCVAKTDVKCLILLRDDFVQMLGDLRDLMDGTYRKRDPLDHASDDGDGTEEGTAATWAKSLPEMHLNNFEIKRTLGVGAFGSVKLVKANDTAFDKEATDGYYALKCISKELVEESGLTNHILNEKAVMSQLSHPFIVRFVSAIQDSQNIYFLLESLLGGELCDMLHSMKTFPEPWTKFYSASVVFAFCHMHSRTIAYRDLKPENLVLDRRGYVKIVDFGLAKKVKDGKTWTWCGTPDYLAPEIILNEGHDWAVDYWALGVLLIELTTGTAPFADDNPMEVYQKILAGNYTVPPNISDELSSLLPKLLNPTPSKRLGRTIGGGGAVLQHKWYADLDCDALLERRIAVPYLPPPRNPEDPSGFDYDQELKDYASHVSGSASTYDGPRLANGMVPRKNNRVSYSLGQGNRHHAKLFELMQSRQNERAEPATSAADRAVVVRKTIIKLANERQSKRTSMEGSVAGRSVASNSRKTSAMIPEVPEEMFEEEGEEELKASSPRRDSMKRIKSDRSLSAIMAMCAEAGENGDTLALPQPKKRSGSIGALDTARFVEDALQEAPRKRKSLDALSAAVKMVGGDERLVNSSSTLRSSSTFRRRSDGKLNIAAAIMQLDQEGASEDGHETKKEETMDSFLKVQLMNLALAIKAEQTKRDGVAFDQFSLISVKPETIVDLYGDECEGDIVSEGLRYLDPFAIQAVDMIDKFPNSSSEADALEPEALSAFCFPNGIKVRLMPRAAMKGAQRIGLVGKESDEYQLHGFTAVTGELSHGIAITIWEELATNNDDACDFVGILREWRERRRACGVIVRSLRRFIALRHEAATLIARTWKMHLANLASQRAKLKRGERPAYSRRHSDDSMGFGEAEMDEPLRIGSGRYGRRHSDVTALRSSLDRRGSQKQILSNVLGKWVSGMRNSTLVSGDSDDSFSSSIMNLDRSTPAEGKAETKLQGSSTQDFCNWDGFDSGTVDRNRQQRKTVIQPVERPPVSDEVRRLAVESYQEMLKNDTYGDACLVQKCYIMIGTRPEEQSLIFCALQQLIDLEREDNAVNQQLSRLSFQGHTSLSKGFRRGSDLRSSTIGRPKRGSSYGPPRSSSQGRLSFFSENRHSILMALQTKLRLSPQETRVKLPKDMVRYRRGAPKSQSFQLDMPIGRFRKIELPLPLPQMSGQWGLSRLLLRIRTSDLIMLLKLLLMERSVLIIGISSEEVTAACFALLELLDPYTWASAFMPILPIDMLDFVSSPVPFIAGVVVNSLDELLAVEDDDRVLAAMQEGLSVLNLSSGLFSITAEYGIEEMLRRAATPSTQLAFYQARVRQFASDGSSALRSFSTFFKVGPTLKESLTLQSMKSIIKQHLQSFAGPLLEHPDTWKLFGDFNDTTGTFDFSPDKFLQPLKDQMIFQLQFQEMMAHTQLFVGFVEDMQRYCETRDEMLVSDQAQFIADWLSFRWMLFNKKKSAEISLSIRTAEGDHMLNSEAGPTQQT